MANRFTLDGSGELEAHLAGICRLVGEKAGKIVGQRSAAILLGGGYGRGEGGVLRTAGGDRPYNDLEFYISIPGHPRLNEFRYSERLHELAETLTRQAGIEVEFKITSLQSLKRSPVSMFTYDLVMGHRWILGQESLLDAGGRHRDATAIPFSEASRLLMNRCTGLLFSRERLRAGSWTDEDANFVGRNIAKAELAYGDAVLTAAGAYHWSALVRHESLRPTANQLLPQELTQLVVEHHIRGLAFKLHPCLYTTGQHEELKHQLDSVIQLGRRIWLFLESIRLGRKFSTIGDYLAYSGVKIPENGPSWLNRLRLARVAGWRSLLRPRGERYPREHLFDALCILLWEPESVAHQARVTKLDARMGVDDLSWQEVFRAYQNIWAAFR